MPLSFIRRKRLIFEQGLLRLVLPLFKRYKNYRMTFFRWLLLHLSLTHFIKLLIIHSSNINYHQLMRNICQFISINMSSISSTRLLQPPSVLYFRPLCRFQVSLSPSCPKFIPALRFLTTSRIRLLILPVLFHFPPLVSAFSNDSAHFKSKTSQPTTAAPSAYTPRPTIAAASTS